MTRDRCSKSHIPDSRKSLPGATDFLALGQLPVRPWEMAGVAVGIALQIILALGLGLPEVANWRHFGHHFARPNAL